MKNQSDWMRPPTDLRLQNDEVHVWRSTLDLPTESIERFAILLSADEQIRADRFRFAQHRQRFIAGRGILRSLLGRYLQSSGNKSLTMLSKPKAIGANLLIC